MENQSFQKKSDDIDQYSLSSILQVGQWLKLEDIPSHLAEKEALILCEVSPRKWITWIPNHGEYCLIL